MKAIPMSITDAKSFIASLHRHNLPPVSGLFAVGCEHRGKVVGVAVAGRPVARMLQDGTTVEITRTCTDETKNANSFLYGCICRAALALGYRRAVTYTLANESGVSLRASGFVVVAKLKPRATWDCPARSRMQVDLFGNDRRPTGAKLRWEKRLGA